MSKFKVGDRVRVRSGADSHPFWYGKELVIYEVMSENRVRADETPLPPKQVGAMTWTPRDLEPAENGLDVMLREAFGE